MRIARSLRFTAAAALSSVVATIAFTGPLAGSALAGPKPRTPLPANITPSTTAALTGVTTMQFTWTPTSTATLTCSLDGGKAVNCPTGSPSYGPLADGTHTFNLKIGKTSSTRPNTYTYSWTIDTTPPAAPTVHNAVSSPTSNTTATITWTDNGSGIAGHLCALDAATPAPCTTFPPITGLTEGSHTAYVYAVDLIGNRSAAGSVTWIVDLTAPGSPVFSTVPANPTKVTVGQFTWQDGDATSFTCKLDGSSVTPCNPAGTSTVPLADGVHTFSVQGVDLAQNVGLPATYSWLVDTQAPPMPLITSGPPSLSDVGSANFVFGDADTTASFLCSVDDSSDGAFTACQSPAGYSVGDGSHVFYVKAVDAAGNVSSPRSYGWSVDTTANVISAPAFFSGPAAFTKVQAPAFTWLDLDAATDHDECSVDGGAYATCVSGDAFSVSPEGPHVLALRSLDSTNTSSEVVSWRWTYDATPPSAPNFSTKPASISNTKDALFSFASEAGAGFTCSLDGAPATACASPVTYVGLDDGQHTFDVTAHDAADNTSTSSFAWRIDTSAPGAPVLTGPSGLVGTADATLSWVANDPTITATSCTLNDVDYPACASPVSLPGLEDGTYTFVVTVANGSTHTAADSKTWTVDTTPPALSLDGLPTEGDVVNHASEAPVATQADAHPGAISCTLNANPSSCSSLTGLTDGDYTFEATTTDQAGNIGTPVSRSWTVDRTAPTLELAVPTSLPANDDLVSHAGETFTLVQTDDHPGTITCTLDGATSDCGSIDTSADGSYTFVASVTDAAGNDATPLTRTWTVDRTAPSPVVSIDGVADGSTVNKTGGYVVNITQLAEPHPGTPVCSLNDVVVDCTALATPADGLYTLTVNVTDAAGNVADPVSYSWTVDTAGPAKPSIDGDTLANGGVTSSRQPVLTATDSDPVSSYDCSVTGTPATVQTCSAGTDGVISFNGDLADGSYSVTVTALDGVSNPSPVSDAFTFYVDNVVPVLSLAGLPAQDAVVKDVAETPNVTQVETHEGAITCTLNNVATDCGSVTTTDEGLYTFKADTTDAAGNAAETVSRSWTVDHTAPALDVTGLPAAGSLVNHSSESVTISQGAESHPGTVTCTLNGNPASCSLLTGLTSGAYTFTADTTDAAGNQAATFTRSWHVDVVAPTATVKTPTTLAGKALVTFTEPVTLSLGNPQLRLTGGAAVPTTATCFQLATTVPCATTGVTSVALQPKRLLVPGQHYTAALAAGGAQDAASNLSPAASKAFRAQRVLQESTTVATASWSKVTNRTAFGRSFVREHKAGTQAKWAFRGRTFTWWTVTGPTEGKARVFVDGKRKATVSNYTKATHYRVARTFKRLGAGRHVVTIRVLGVKGARNATGTFVSIDAFTVGKVRTATPKLATSWHRVTGSGYYARHAVSADLKGEAISLTFRGRSISWTTMRNRSQGKVAIYIDGVRKATVDNFSTRTIYKVRRTVSKLSDKVHTLRIVVLGTHHKGARGNTVTVDRFAIG